MSKAYSNSTPADADGNAEIDFEPPSTYQWNVTQITVSAASTNSSTAKVFVDQRYFCGSAVGNGDSADGSALIVNNGSKLRIIWAGVDIGGVCTANIQVDEQQIGQQ